MKRLLFWRCLSALCLIFVYRFFGICEGKAFSKVFNDETEKAMDKIVRINTESGLELYEGDIVLHKEDLQTVDMSEEGDIDGKYTNEATKRNAIRQREKLWHNRVIPYEIAKELSSYTVTIMKALDEYHKKTCLKFVPRTTEGFWIKFVQKQGCWSSIGRISSTSKSQEISLGSGCNNTGIVIHELMHAIGFFHEQSRPDRNQYIEVFWENIKEGQSHNFNKYSHNMLDILGVQYDYGSIMHYGSRGFSKNGKMTIKVIGNNNVEIGQRVGFSNTDVIKINALYNCHLNGVGWSEWSSYSPCSSTCVKRKQRYCFSANANECPGVDQYGIETQQTKCPNEECYAPVDGHWGRWSSWSTCNTTCGQGKKSRTRLCDDPPPRNGGRDCQGDAKAYTQCLKGACNLGPDDCEFGPGNYCHWTSINTNPDYEWNIHSGQTPSRGTGPMGDHTTGSGYYVYTEASSPATPGSIAVLKSKEFPASQCRCMSWSYNMFGPGIGDLKVYVQPSGQHRRVIWHKSGSQRPEWIRDEATIGGFSQTSYNVQFESVRGPRYDGDIALDDIFFQEQPCGVEPLGCYKDMFFDRALPDLIVNLRSKIDWYDMQKTIKECACAAHEKGYKYFAVQFYGECWGSKTEVQYDKYGQAASDTCWNNVGTHFTNFVYKFKN